MPTLLVALLALGLAACAPGACCSGVRPLPVASTSAGLATGVQTEAVAFDVGPLDWTTATASSIDPALADAPFAIPVASASSRP